ncbi:MAG: DNA polymerase III subunit alpha [Candidatus Eisenbacteria bacterium]|nr:DNA polymerase III subunit alpha [Candidatus Eisenbacteria bacterium]
MLTFGVRQGRRPDRLHAPRGRGGRRRRSTPALRSADHERGRAWGHFVGGTTFVHLHNHTQYSLLDGVSRVPDLVARTKSLGMPAVAITDHGNLFGVVPFYEAARQAGVKPIVGMEAYVAPGARHDREEGRHRKPGHLVLLAQNETGYRNLLRLSSRSFLEGFYYKPRVDRELLRDHSQGLVALSGCLAGEINQRLRAGKAREAESRAREYREIFDGRFYLELQDHGLGPQRDILPQMIDLGRRLDIPLVATNDCHYLHRAHAEAHDVLLCIQTGKTHDDPRRTLRFETDEMYFKSPDEMRALFDGLPDALENTVRIAESCRLELELGRLRLPHVPCPGGYADLDDYLAHLCREGLKRHYGSCAGAIDERLEYELGVIRQMGYAGYFLIVQDFINFARREKIPVGPGRGSAAGSLVAYALGITNIDPLKYGLIFERFLNPERVTMPDIDIDFADKDRPRIIRYVVERYGEENVSQIITFGTMAARAATRDVGRVLGLPYGEVDRIAKMIPVEPGMTLERALEMNPELRETTEGDQRYRRLMRIARVLEGTNRHASTHAAGIVISDTPLIDTIPLYKTPDGEVTTQFDMGASERVGLLKIDLLGLRTLTVIKDCLRLIRENRNETIDIDAIPLDDPAVFQLMSRGDTVGVFQFESSGMVDYLRKLRPESLEDLIAMNALYRPGPLRSGMVDDFILRKQGRRQIRFEHAALEPILKETYGVIVYQEQVMRIASELAGYSLGEADLLRRAMGKKKEAIMAQQKATFLERSQERGTKRGAAEKIFDLMAYFAGYGFNRSHSAGYALVAYQTAYLKAHYPVEFMAASMTSEMSNSDRLKVLLSECRRLGITVRPPDVRRSQGEFAVDGESIWFGLEAVKGVGRGAVEAILDMRRTAGEPNDLFHLCEVVDTAAVNRKALESLIQAGGLDGFGLPRARLLNGLPLALEWGGQRRRDRLVGQSSLFGDGGSGGRPPALPEEEEWPDEERLRREKEALGFYLTGHPLDAYRDLTAALGVAEISGLSDLTTGRPVVVAGIVTGVRGRRNKQGQPIAFFMLDDGSAVCECSCFAEAYARWGGFLVPDRPLYVQGTVRGGEGEETKVNVDELRPLEEMIKGGQLSLHLIVDPAAADGDLQDMRRTLEGHRGEAPVFVNVDPGDGHPILIRLRSAAVRPEPGLLQRLRTIPGVAQVRLHVEPGNGNGSRAGDAVAF